MRVWAEPINESPGMFWLCLGSYVRLRCPDNYDRTPRDWWHVEAITEIAARRVAEDWTGTGAGAVALNEALVDTMRMLAWELAEVADDTFDTIDKIRRFVVWQRVRRDRFLVPCCFVTKNVALSERVRRLLEDVYGDVLFTMAGSAKQRIPAIVHTVDGRAEVRKLVRGPDASGVFFRSVRFCRPGEAKAWSKKRGGPKYEPNQDMRTPVDLVQDLIAFPPDWPQLNGIVRVPMIKRDGTIMQTVGYDRSIKIWYEPEPVFQNMRVPDNPTAADVEWAQRTLWFPFSEYAFQGGASGSGSAIAALFEQLMMPLLADANRPLYAVTAPVQSSGKTTLCQMIGAILTGSRPAASQKGLTEEEVEKRITTFLLKEEQFYLLDNLRQRIASESLAALATSPKISGRILGRSEGPDLVNIATWMLTLNNAELDADLARRIVMTVLDPGVQPREVFTIREPIEYAKAYRAQIVSAALLLIRAWIVAGAPRDTRISFSSYERWSDTVASAVAWAGFDGIPQAIQAARGRNIEAGDDQRLLSLWRTRYRGVWYSAAAVAAIAAEAEAHTDLIKDVKFINSWIARRFAETVLVRLVRQQLVSVRGTPGYREYLLAEDDIGFGQVGR